MRLTSENIERIQQYLIERGFIQSVASGEWDNQNKITGYQTYLESLGVPYPENTELPVSVQMLPAELRDYVTVPDNFYDPETDNEDSDETEDDDLEDEEIDLEDIIDDEDLEDERDNEDSGNENQSLENDAGSENGSDSSSEEEPEVKVASLQPDVVITPNLSSEEIELDKIIEESLTPVNSESLKSDEIKDDDGLENFVVKA